MEHGLADLEILDLKLSVLNEHILKNLNSSVSLNKEENIILKIESNNFAFDREPNELELNSYLEIRYTNQVGKENNLCNVFKIQTNVKFTQVVLAEIKKINDLNEQEFELVLNIKNLLEDKLIKCFYMNYQIEIKPKMDSNIKVKIKKFDFESLLGSNNYNSSSVDNLNKIMDIFFSLESEKEKFKVLLSELGPNLNSYLSIIYKFPFTLKSFVKLDLNSTKTFNYCSVMLVILNKPELSFLQDGFSLKANIRNKIKNFFVIKNFTWLLDVTFF